MYKRQGFDYADVLWAAFPKPCMLSAASEDFFLLEACVSWRVRCGAFTRQPGTLRFFQFR